MIRALLLMLIVVFGCSTTDPVQVVDVFPEGAVVPGEVDLGTLSSGAAMTRAFRLRNKTAVEARIVRFDMSCECAEIVPASVLLAPGDERDCELVIDLQREGDFFGRLGIEIRGRNERNETIFIHTASVDVQRSKSETRYDATD